MNSPPNPCSRNDWRFLCAGDGVLQPPRPPQPPRLQKVPRDEMVRIDDVTQGASRISDFERTKTSESSRLSLSLALGRVAYGSKAHFLNILLYLLGLMPLTYLILSMRPGMSINGTGDHNITMVDVSFQEVPQKALLSTTKEKKKELLITMRSSLFSKQSLLLSFCMVMVLVMNIYAIIRELVQMSHQVCSCVRSCGV